MGLITRPFDEDPVAGMREIFHYDDKTGDVYIETIADVEQTVEINKAQYASMDERARWRDGFNHVGRIPLIFFQMHPELMYDDEALRKWLNNPDHRSFRSRPGRL